jgi:hypothetical protein
MGRYFDNNVYNNFKGKRPSEIKRLSADDQKFRLYVKTNLTS